jgi:hypothetical protein
MVKAPSKKAHPGSLPNRDLALANQFLPAAQLRFSITAGHDLSQTTLAEGGNFQWNRRILRTLLNLSSGSSRRLMGCVTRALEMPSLAAIIALVIPESRSISCRHKQAWW